MAKMPFDLKKFQHVKSDKNSTTLQHADGHILTIAHKALSPEFQKQLSALSKLSKQDETPDQAEEAQANSKVKMAGGGGVEDAFRNHFGVPLEQAAAALGVSADLGADKIAAAYRNMMLNNPGAVPVPMQQQAMPPHYVDPLAAQKQAPVYSDAGIANQANYEQQQKVKDQAIQSDEQAYQDKQNKLDEPIDESGYKNYDEGGDVQADPQEVRSENPNYQPPFEAVKEPPLEVKPNPYASMYNNIYAQVKSTNPGLPDSAARQQALNVVESQQSADKSNTKIASEDAQDKQNQVMQENQRRQAIGLEPMPLPAVPPLPSGPTQEQPGASIAPALPQPQQPQEVSMRPGSSREPESMLEAGYQNKLSGIQQGAAAQGALGAEQAQLLNKNLEDQRTAQLSFRNSYQDLENERQAHMQDIKDGYIDPNNYWKDHSKVMSGIGMILAGFNPTNSPNAAVNFLKFQMEQNMEAQRQNLGAKQNMLNANLRQFGNLRDAMDMTRVMQNDIMTHELQSAAAKAQSPMAKAAAMQAAGQLQMDAAPMFQDFAMRRAFMNMAQNGSTPGALDHILGYLRFKNPEMAKEMESRYVPGVGLANVPVPEKVRGDMIAKEQFQKALNDMQMFAQKHSGSLNPATIAEGKTMAANVQNLYREGINGGVFKQGEQSFINGIIDADPTKFFNSIRVLPKLNEAQRENAASLNILKRNYGLPVPQQQVQQFKTDKNGVKWQRGPKGEAIRVK